MSTFEHLVEANVIVRIDVEMGLREQPMRLLYGTPDFISWLNSVLAGAQPSNRLGEATPTEQIDQLFYNFLSGFPLVHMRQFRFIRSEKNAVWELKTPDIRIFGWFLQKDCFVCVFGNWADEVKDHNLYRGYRIAIRRFRRELNLDDSFCVQGVDPSDVISL